MDAEELPQPWSSFLDEIDEQATCTIRMVCIGGFAVSLFCGLARPTGDIDVVDAKPPEAKLWLSRIAGAGSALHQKHKVHLQIVTVATLPYLHEERLVEIFPKRFNRLLLFVPDPYDLVLSKLGRNLEVDIEDAKHLAQSQHLDLAMLQTRYQAELRPYLIGPVDRHDLTLRLWLDAFREDRLP